MIRRTSMLSAVIVAAFVLLAGFGCAPKRVPGATYDSPDTAWKVFRRDYCRPAKDPGVLVKASLYYTRVKPTRRTNRTLVSMWGDFNGAMRLDIAAGIGKLLAHIREDRDGLLVFYPSEKTAYAHVDSVLGATRLGMPFPFSLSGLARVSVGDFSGLVPKRYAKVARTDAGFVYEVRDGQVDTVTLDVAGRPVLLEGATTTGHDARRWSLVLDRYQDTAATPLADRVTLTMDNGEKGVLRIKSRELKMTPWPDKATGLELPEDVIIRRLDNGYTNAEHDDIPVVYEDE